MIELNNAYGLVNPKFKETSAPTEKCGWCGFDYDGLALCKHGGVGWVSNIYQCLQCRQYTREVVKLPKSFGYRSIYAK